MGHSFVAGIQPIGTYTAAADRYNAATTGCILTMENLPLRNLGNVLDWNDRIVVFTAFTSFFVLS